MKQNIFKMITKSIFTTKLVLDVAKYIPQYFEQFYSVLKISVNMRDMHIFCSVMMLAFFMQPRGSIDANAVALKGNL